MNNRELATLVLSVILVIVFLDFIFGWIGKMSNHLDDAAQKQMVECQAAGKSYGECYNVINERSTYKFNI